MEPRCSGGSHPGEGGSVGEGTRREIFGKFTLALYGLDSILIFFLKMIFNKRVTMALPDPKGFTF